MKPDQIKHSLAVGPKSIQSRVYDRETGELISFVKMPLEETGLVSREALAEQPRKPLTKEEIAKFYGGDSPLVIQIIRDTESAHGIKGTHE